ncbi:hypothetical protein Desaci_2529 [Desulfosporosinus acidiphilus SJ4]|uniref:Uncharacterized protein n=1 Tax=Desulfosporosinus acidiphilus (strain DSM 22704 / JCM 16185 / SJ4) TaxID=646529 RepID=I4D6P9_DESAJ|nr:hypothetical protein [Desulfosporosinus acidiphilus]AFM41473.1 hypothetical protein Desaci_2529 [Desulfosporosinus acidiphilus SJ4]
MLVLRLQYIFARPDVRYGRREPIVLEESGVNASDIQRVAFSVLGLLLLGNSIPKVVSAFLSFYTMKVPNSTARLFGSLGFAGTIAQFIIGLGIFLGSQGLVNLLDGIRHAGLNREKHFEDND